MEDSKNRPFPSAGEVHDEGLASIRRRRQILAGIGKASAAAGLAAPLASLANSGGHPWCYMSKTNTTPVQATISGCGSVLMSVQGSGPRNWGYPCSHYKTKTSLPSNCQGKNFSWGFPSCVGQTDSQKQPYYSNGNLNPNCLFNMTFDVICANYSSTVEAHWCAAFINSTYGYPSSQFPYAPSDVAGHYANINIKQAAYNFYTYCMENG